MARGQRKATRKTTNAKPTTHELAREIMTNGHRYPTTYFTVIAEMLLEPLLSSGVEAAVSELHELNSNGRWPVELPAQLKYVEPGLITIALVEAECAATSYLHVEPIIHHVRG
jgi:hypothetical protein